MTEAEPADAGNCRPVNLDRLMGFLGNQGKGEEREKLEAAPGFEPGMRVLQTRALPLGDAAPVNFLL